MMLLLILVGLALIGVGLATILDYKKNAGWWYDHWVVAWLVTTFEIAVGVLILAVGVTRW